MSREGSLASRKKSSALLSSKKRKLGESTSPCKPLNEMMKKKMSFLNVLTSCSVSREGEHDKKRKSVNSTVEKQFFTW